VAVAKKGSARRVLGRIAAILAALVFFCFSSVLAVVLHLGLPSARRIVVERVDALLADELEGKVHIERLDSLSIFGAGGVRARLFDRDRRPLAFVDDVRIRIHPFVLAKSLLSRKGDLKIAIREISIGWADASLDADERGVLRLTRALTPRHPSTGAPGRATTVTIERAKIRLGKIHGRPEGSPQLDVDIGAVHGSVFVSPATTAVDVGHLALRSHGMPRGLDPEGNLEGRVAMFAKSDTTIDASFSGAIGGIPSSVRGSMNGKNVHASVVVPRVGAERVRAIVPEIPLSESVNARIDARGVWPNVDASMHVDVGRATFEVFARATIAEEIRARLRVDAKSIDAHSFIEDGPRSSIDMSSEASLSLVHGAIDSDFAIVITRATVSGDTFPKTQLAGTLHREGQHTTLDGRGNIAEEGALIALTFAFDDQESHRVLDVRADAPIPRLERVRWLGQFAKGRTKLRARARLDFGVQRCVDATLEADLDDVERDFGKIRHGTLEARAMGSLDAPSLHATLRADHIEASGTKFSRALVTASGTSKHQDVSIALDGENVPSVRADVRIALGNSIALDVSRLTLWRNDVTAVVRAPSVRIEGDDVVVDDAVVEGLGQALHASFRKTSTSMAVRARSSELDVGRITRLAGVERVTRGVLALDLDLDLHPRSANGHVLLELEDAFVEGASTAASAHLDARIDGHTLSGELKAKAQGFGNARLRTDEISIGSAGPLSERGWKDATGSLDLEARLNMSKLVGLAKDVVRPFSELDGRLDVDARIVRETATQRMPTVTLVASTSDLIFAVRDQGPEKIDGMVVEKRPISRITGVDLEIAVRIDGDSGDSTIAARMLDRKSPLVLLDAKSERVPYDQLLASNEPLLERLEKIPFSANLVVPRHALGKLPPVLALAGSRGHIESNVSIRGTLAEPKLDFVAKVDGFAWRGAPLGVALGSEVHARYDGRLCNVDVRVWSPQRPLLDGTVTLNAKASDLFAHRNGVELAWDASARVRAMQFPLAALAALSDRRIRGALDGEITIDALHKDARAKIALQAKDLVIGTAKYRSAKLDVTFADRDLQATLRFDQTDGFAELKANAGIVWGTALAPHLEPTRKVEASFLAKRFRAAPILPFVEETLSELDGRIDADAHLLFDPASKKPSLRGEIVLRDMVFHLASTGGAFHDGHGRIRLSDEGIRIEEFAARGVTGRAQAAFLVHLDGLSLADATGKVTVDQNEAIPLDVEGVYMGEVWGEIGIGMKPSPDKKQLIVDVDVPKMHVDLPIESASHELQPLEPPEHVHVGVYRSGDRFVILPTSQSLARQQNAAAAQAGTQFVLNVHLHNDVEVRRGSGLRVALEGEPIVKLNGKTQVSGQIRLKSGYLEVQGKRFEIEKGTVSFLGPDPSNPQVVITAGWNAPDGTRIFADYVGPVKSGKVTLRSEPTRTKAEIVALIIYGSADSGTAAEQVGGPSTAARGAATAGGFASEGLSKGIDDLTGLDVTVKVDTTTSANPRPGLEIQIARNISLQLSFVLGTPPPGTNPDKTLATVAWRFLRNWSLDATFGDAGSSIADVVWQRAY